MKYPIAPRQVARFGPFEVDLQAGQLRKNGLKVKLQDQPFQILAMLLEHAGEVVTREELHQRLWPADTFTDFDHGLNNAINRLREALCDSADKPRYVETLPRRGYRFIAPVDAGVGLAPPALAPEEELTAGGVRAPQGVPLPGGNGGAVATEAGPAVVVRELPSQPLWPLRLAAITAMLVVGVAVGWYVWHGSHSRITVARPDRIQSIAVLPL